MKTKLLLLLACQFSLLYGQLDQESQRIKYFSDHNDTLTWGQVYSGGAATTNATGGQWPMETIDGEEAMKIESTKPNGWWNTVFQVGSQEVNYNRMGSSPYLYLRVKWTNIASGANLQLELQSYEDDRHLGGTDDKEQARVSMNTYVTPSSDWQDVYIPIADFLSNNPDLNLSRIPVIRFLGQGVYSDTHTMYLSRMDVVPSSDDQYLDAVKVNQVGYLPNQPKIGIISFEPGAASSTPTSFYIITEPGGSVVYSGSLSLQTAFAPQWGQDNDEVYHAFLLLLPQEHTD